MHSHASWIVGGRRNGRRDGDGERKKKKGKKGKRKVEKEKKREKRKKEKELTRKKVASALEQPFAISRKSALNLRGSVSSNVDEVTRAVEPEAGNLDSSSDCPVTPVTLEFVLDAPTIELDSGGGTHGSNVSNDKPNVDANLAISGSIDS